MVICAVPGCERDFAHEGALGPHYAKHRRDGDKGVPAPSPGAAAKAKRRKTKANLPAVVKTKSKPAEVRIFTPRDVSEVALQMMCPDHVRRDDVYDIVVWVNHTETLAARLMAIPA